MPKKLSIIIGVLLLFAATSSSWAQTTINIPLGYSTNGYSEKKSQTTGASIGKLATFGVTNPNNDYLPSIKGELSVSDVGALNYVLPIEVIKGVNSFQPNVALAYNSQSGNGMAGWGWNITGLSMITIGGKSKAIDGITIGAQYDGNDPFYLDGQRLMPGVESNTFVTQKFSTIKVTKDYSKDFPFIVQFPDGKISKFKDLQSNGNYYISTISDALGNEIHYTYTTKADETNNGIVTRYAPYLEKISYGGTSTTPDKYYIKFAYSTRKIPLSAYSRGINYITNQILSSITVGYLDDNSKTVDHRTYSFSFDFIQNNTIERLIGIQLKNQLGSLLPNDLTFDYNDVQSKGNANLITEKAQALAQNTTGLGAVTSGFFSNFSSKENTPIYQIKQGTTYQLNNGVNLGTIKNDANTKLFSGKVLGASNTITQDDQLIVVNEEYTGKVEPFGKPDLPSLHDFLVFNIKDILSGNVIEIKTEVKSGYNQMKDIRRDYPAIRDVSKRKFIQGDLNNDGLTDFLIIENENLARKNRIYFLDIGKQNKSASVDATILYEGAENFYDKEIYPVELDGDGRPELMVVDRVKFTYSVYKIDLSNKSISLFNNLQNITLNPNNEKNFTKNTPLFFGDFNGDGLTDFITPNKVYEIPSNDNGDGSVMAQVYQQMETEKLLWKMYTATGTQYLVSDKDFTAQKIAYLKSAQNNNIYEPSWWDKFWSGDRDTYNYTRYATHNIIITDFNNDGKSDIIIFNKIGKVKYDINGIINDAPVSNLPNIDNSSIVNRISFFENTLNSKNEQTFSSLASARTSIENVKLSPFSLILPKIDFDKLNVSTVGLFVHDLILGQNIKLTIDNSSFLEKEIQQVDNSSGIVQKIEYRNMIDRLGENSIEVAYIYQPPLNLKYPFYVHPKNPSVYLVAKIHTLFNNNTQILTKEYRYQNAIQNFNGKGFIGFQKTFTSDPYESEQVGTGSSSTFRIKYPLKAVLWSILTKDPLFDNAVVTSTYGGLINFLTTSTTNYQKLSKLGESETQELTLATDVVSVDNLKKINSSKKYSYDDKNGYKLVKVSTNFNDIGSSVTSYNYEKPNTPTDCTKPFFDGKIINNTSTIYKDGLSFSTHEETTHDAKGLPTSVTKYNDDKSQSLTTSFEYDTYGYGNVTKKTVVGNGIASLSSTYTYDGSNRFVTATKTTDGLTTNAEYDALGKVTKEISPLGQTMVYTYDNWGNVIKTSSTLADPKLSSTPAPIDVSIETKKITIIDQIIPNEAVYYIHKTPTGSSESYTYYDVFDRVVMTKTKSLNDFVCSQIQYDILGNKIAYSEPYFYKSGSGTPTLWNKTDYDDLNRPILTTTFTGKEIKSCYEGTTVTVDDGFQQSSKTIDAMGHTIRAQDNGGVINYSYFPNGALRETDYEGIKNTFTIDRWGNKISQTVPSIGNYTYEYDILGRLTKETNPKNTKTINTYNSKGLIESVTIKNDADEEISNTSYSYNALNLPIEISGVNKSRLSFSYKTTYDNYYRPVTHEESNPDFKITTSTTYDDSKYGRVQRVDKTTTNNGSSLPTFSSTTTVINEYDATTGIVIKQTDGTNTTPIWELKEINAWGKTTKMNYGNGYTIDNTYNNNATLAEIKHQTASNNTFFNFNYTYNINKGVLTKRESQYYDNSNNKTISKTEDFAFDELNRLTKETTNNNSINYTYDNRGRMTSNDQLGTYTFNSKDYLLQNIKLNSSGKDINSKRGFVAATYNELRYTETLTLPSATEKLNFEYNILEGRYSMADNNNGAITTKYYSADYSVEIIKNSTTNTTQLITYITGSPYTANYIKVETLGGIATPKNYYLHRDNISSIVGITDATGAMVEQRFFDAWGNLKVWVNASGTATTDADVNNNWASTSLLIDRGYTGHEHLWQAGLINMNARMYDPVLRRFLSADDVLPDLFNTQDYNRFGYGRNNPLLYIDPDGHEPITMIVIAVAVAITANGINNAINGIPFWYGMGKAATIGAISGAVSFGIGSVAGSSAMFGSQLSLGKAAFEAGMHGITGGLISQANGGNFGSGFFSGMVSSAVASGVNAIGINFSQMNPDGSNVLNGFGEDYMQAAMIAAGGLSGGISSTIAGGNFWDGLRQGIITSALNHVAHLAQGDPKPKPKSEVKKDAQSVEGGVGTAILDGVQTGLDVVGLVPGVGEIADGVNSLIYAGRGDYVNAGLSAAAMVPFAGWAATGGKLFRKTLMLTSKARTAERGLEIGGRFLKAGYKEIAPGVFRSADNLRQFRMTDADILGLHGNIGPHFNFEIYSPNNLFKPIINYHMPIK